MGFLTNAAVMSCSCSSAISDLRRTNTERRTLWTQADGVLPLIGPVAPTKGNSDSPVNAPVPDGEDQAESNSKSRRSGRIRDVHLKRLAYEAELSASAAEEDDQTSNALTSTLKLESKGL